MTTTNDAGAGRRRSAGLALLCAALVALPGGMTPAADEPEDSRPAPDPTAIGLEDLRAFSDMFRMIREYYVDDVPERALMDAAMAGLVADLDDHSAFLPPDRYRDQNDGNRGRYGGIGIELDKRRQRLFVSDVTPGGPAERADVRVGDQLLAVDGQPVRGRLLQRSADALLGAPGSAVRVRIRSGDAEARDLELTREYLPVDSVHGRWLEPGFAYLSVSHFHDRSDADLERELERLEALDDSTPLQGIVIDLRGNRGGVITSALTIADGFLDEGLVVETRGRTPSSRMEYWAQPGQYRPDSAVALLVDGLTASSSEILAGALQDHGRATVVGQTTFGKGTVQSVVQLRNGSALKLTTARYYTPDGRVIERSGIKPDIEVPRPKRGPGRAEVQADAVLDAALAALKSARAAG